MLKSHVTSAGVLPVIVIYQAEILEYYHQSTVRSQGLVNWREAVKDKGPRLLTLGISPRFISLVRNGLHGLDHPVFLPLAQCLIQKGVVKG